MQIRPSLIILIKIYMLIQFSKDVFSQTQLKNALLIEWSTWNIHDQEAQNTIEDTNNNKSITTFEYF